MSLNGILDFLQKKPRRKYTRKGDKKYKKYKEDARALVRGKIAQLNAHYGFRVGRVSIRNTKSRWGSCSKQGNLNFNYKVLFLPPHIADYVIVHELCHLKEFNHSANFWNLVAETVPNHKAIRAELKRTAHLYR